MQSAQTYLTSNRTAHTRAAYVGTRSAVSQTRRRRHGIRTRGKRERRHFHSLHPHWCRVRAPCHHRILDLLCVAPVFLNCLHQLLCCCCFRNKEENKSAIPSNSGKIVKKFLSHLWLRLLGCFLGKAMNTTCARCYRQKEEGKDIKR